MSKLKNILKYIYNINYTFYILIFNFLIITFTIFIILFFYKSDTIMFKAVDIFDERTQNVLNVKEKRDSLMKFIENINLFSSKLFKPISYSNYEKLPVFDLKLNRKNIDYINDVISRSLDQSNNVYSSGPFISIYDNDFIDDTKTTFLYDNEKYNVKVKLHGVADDNWINPKKSYSFKTSKEKLFKNIRRFKLIVLEEQSIQTLFSYYLSDLMGYFRVNTEIVRLRINGVDQGLYLFEESLSEDLLEKNQLPGVDVIRALDEWTHQYNTGHLTLFTHETANQNFDNITGKDLGQLSLFNKLMTAKTFKEIENIVDIEKFALFEAMRIIFATNHAIAGDNLKILFDTTSGKFFPFFRMEGYLLPLPKSDLSNTFDSELNDWFGYDYKIKIFPLLNSDDNFRFLRNQFLFNILNKRDDLEAYYTSLYNEMKLLIKIDKTNNKPARWYINMMESSLDSLTQNFNYIEKYLNYSRVYSTVYLINDNEIILEIVPDSNSAIGLRNIDFGSVNEYSDVKIANLNINNKEYSEITNIKDYFSDLKFSLGLDENLEIKKSKFRFKIKFINEKIDKNSFKISYLNLVTNKFVPDKENYIITTVHPSNLKLIPQDQNFLFYTLQKKYENIEIKNNRLIFKKGFFDIDEDIILPHGFDIEIESGANLNLHPNISILGRSNLKIDGSKETVTIKNAIPSKPFGVIGIVGTNKTNVSIHGLNIQGGSEDMISGLFLSGALSLYHHDKIKIFSSEFSNNMADDGLNIKNANVEIKNSLFKFNFADAIDLDFCSGILSNNNFINNINAKNKNGDGLDLSGSEIIIKNNIFSSFNDKAISIGEKSKAVMYDNLFNNNRSAITLKDESVGYVISNIFNKNQNNIELYQKKAIFRDPVVYISNNNISGTSINRSNNSNVYSAKNIINDIDFDVSNDFNYYLKILKNNNWIKYE